MIAQLDKEYVRTSKKKALTRLISYAFFEGRPITAPGQWINPLVFRNLNHGIKKYRSDKIIKPIFILGTGRSGTTILGKLLSMHGDIGYLNEPKAIWHTLYPNEDLTGNFTTEEASYFVSPDIVDETMINKAHGIYSHYLNTIGSSRVVDKYPELLFRMDFVKRIFPDAVFILIVRNGWDTCSSIDLWSQRKGKKVNGEVHDWWGRDNRKWDLIIRDLVPNSTLLSGLKSDIQKISDHQNMAVVEWILSMEHGLKIASDDTLMVRYEDLVQDPSKTLNQILGFSELKSDGNMIKYAQNVLKSKSNYKEFEMSPFLVSPFNKMMKLMGYE